MFKFTSTSTSTSKTYTATNNDVIVAIVTNNLTKVKSLLNRNNVNNIIDTINNYTALHYAVTLPNNDITKFILDLQADPKIKQSDGYDAYELALRSGKKYIFQYYEKLQELKINDLEIDNKNLDSKINSLKRTNDHLNDSMDRANNKINALHKVIEIKDKEIKKLRKDVNDAEKAFTNLLQKK